MMRSNDDVWLSFTLSSLYRHKSEGEKKIHKSILLIFYDTSFRAPCCGFIAWICSKKHDDDQQSTAQSTSNANKNSTYTRHKYLFLFSFEHQINYIDMRKFIWLNFGSEECARIWDEGRRTKAMKLILIKVPKFWLQDKQNKLGTLRKSLNNPMNK